MSTKKYNTNSWNGLKNQIESFEAEVDSRLDDYLKLDDRGKKAFIENDIILAKAQSLVNKWREIL